jgi:hypothetical protein
MSYKKDDRWALVAHICNPSYSGQKEDQEDHGSKPSWANSSVRPYLEKPLTKKGSRCKP